MHRNNPYKQKLSKKCTIVNARWQKKRNISQYEKKNMHSASNKPKKEINAWRIRLLLVWVNKENLAK
jgi:hypothetical protein